MNLFSSVERRFRRSPGTVHVHLMGGLGNQMFQYAKALALAAPSGRDINLDSRFLRKTGGAHTKREFELDAFHIEATLDRWPGWALKCLPKVEESDSKAPSGANTALESVSCLLKGYWQSEAHFRSVRGKLLQHFTLRDQPSAGMQRIEAQMAGAAHALSIHVRRGDYVSDPNVAAVHGICSLDYYRAAVQKVKAQYPVDACFVFSDDPAWVRQHFDVGIPFTVVPPELGGSPAEHVILMSKCRHHVIANSSFSWWGAWLCQIDGMTVAPRQWFAENDKAATEIAPAAWCLF